jgi:hypothetical protein
MRFQTLLLHRRNSRVYVAGRVIPVDAQGVAETQTAEEEAEFRSMPGEWSADVQEVEPVKPASAYRNQPKTAADLVRDLEVDADLRTRLSGFRSAATRRSHLEGLGYRFTDAELEAVMGGDEPAVEEPAASGEEVAPAHTAEPTTPLAEPPVAPVKATRTPRKGKR